MLPTRAVKNVAKHIANERNTGIALEGCKCKKSNVE
jgi:hypothetical protein